jgi:hypothetical protein
MREAQQFATNSRHLFELWRELVRREAGPEVDTKISARLTPGDYQRYLKDPQRPVLFAQLRQAQLAGHDMDRVLDYVTQDSFRGARSVAAVIHGRVADMDLGEGGTSRNWTERTPSAGQSPPDELRLATQETAAALDHRQRELGLKLAAKPEPWTVRYLGMPPEEPGRLRDDWAARAGRAASYREAAGHTDPEQAVGPAPRNNPELAEAHLSAMNALEMQHEEATARAMDRGSLESRVEHYERARAWAPPEVGQELETATQAEQDAAAQAEAARVRGDEELAASAQALRETMAAERDRMEVERAAREEWDEATTLERERAAAAADELERRGEGPAREPDRPEPEPARQEEADRPGPGELDEPMTQAEADRLQHEVEAAMYEAERAEAAWQEPEISQPEAEIDAPELEV